VAQRFQAYSGAKAVRQGRYVDGAKLAMAQNLPLTLSWIRRTLAYLLQ